MLEGPHGTQRKNITFCMFPNIDVKTLLDLPVSGILLCFWRERERERDFKLSVVYLNFVFNVVQYLISLQELHNIVMWDWQYYTEYSSHLVWNVRIISSNTINPHNIVMDLNNDMFKNDSSFWIGIQVPLWILILWWNSCPVFETKSGILYILKIV